MKIVRKQRIKWRWSIALNRRTIGHPTNVVFKRGVNLYIESTKKTPIKYRIVMNIDIFYFISLQALQMPFVNIQYTSEMDQLTVYTDWYKHHEYTRRHATKLLRKYFLKSINPPKTARK